MKILKKINQFLKQPQKKGYGQQILVSAFDQYEFLHEAIGVGFWKYNLTNNQFLWSNELSKLHGATRSVSTVEDWMHLIHKEDQHRVFLIFRATINQQSNNVIRYRVKREGGVRYFECKTTFREDKKHHKVLIGLVRDVTRERELELLLKLKEPNLETGSVMLSNYDLQDRYATWYAWYQFVNKSFITIRLNENRSVEHANEAFFLSTGLSDGNVIGVNMEELISIDASSESFYKWLKSDEREWAGEGTLHAKHGNNCQFAIHGFKEFMTQNILVILRDISDEKLERNKLVEELNNQKQLNEMKTQFVSMASHQFRTPLAIIQTNAELFAYSLSQLKTTNALKDTATKAVYRIEKEVASMKTMMDHVMLYGDLAKSFEEMPSEMLDLVSIIHKIVEDQRKLVSDTVSLQVEVIGDPRKVSLSTRDIQICMDNLLSNAIKYSDEHSKITIKVSFEQSAFCVIVKDNGIGIPEAELNDILKPFKRASNVGAAVGTGLGLLIVRECVQKYQGNLDITSKLNEGTEVKICFTYDQTPNDL